MIYIYGHPLLARFQIDRFALSEGFDIGKGVNASTLSVEHHYWIGALLDLI